MSIEYIDIVHHLHTDLGYTDHPLRARRLHAKFVGQAVEAVLASADKADPYGWTCETQLGVSEWLKSANETQKAHFYQAAATGNLDITAIPVDITPFYSAEQWEKMLHWMPAEFYEHVKVESAMQNDIGGFPAAAVEKLLDRGVKYLWMGPNNHLSRPPFITPHAFRWKMKDGRSIFVWLNGHYNNAFYIFNDFWREGPIPNSSDTCYRYPDAKDIFKTDDESLEKAHEQCSKCMAAFEGREPNAGQFVRDGFVFNKIEGVYPYKTLCLSLTNHWRMDNDPPILHLQEFVEKWNAKGYTPKLRLATATQAMRHIEAEAGDNLEVVEGEWVDWWANGMMATPAEVAYAREAERTRRFARSAVFGKMNTEDEQIDDRILRDLCLFSEHTGGNWKSIEDPFCFDSVAGLAEVNILAYRSLDAAQNLLADRLRALKDVDEAGVWVVNPTKETYCGWVQIPANCLRGEFTHLRDAETNALYPLEKVSGAGKYERPNSMDEVGNENETTDFPQNTPRIALRFWLTELKSESLRHLVPCCDVSETTAHTLSAEIETDKNGWPVRVQYAGCETPLFESGTGEFISYGLDSFAPRWALIDIYEIKDSKKRMEARERMSVKTPEYGETVREESAHDVTYTQYFSHPSLKWGKRVLTLRKDAPQARLGIRIRRLDNPQPEIYYLRVAPTTKPGLPTMSLGGKEFVPGVDQIPNTCMDYYSIDGWARYAHGKDTHFVNSKDTPMLCVGNPNCFARVDHLDPKDNDLFFMLFDNTWDTNFAANMHGVFEYQFDMVQNCGADAGQTLADVLNYKPKSLVCMR